MAKPLTTSEAQDLADQLARARNMLFGACNVLTALRIHPASVDQQTAAVAEEGLTKAMKLLADVGSRLNPDTPPPCGSHF